MKKRMIKKLISNLIQNNKQESNYVKKRLKRDILK